MLGNLKLIGIFLLFSGASIANAQKGTIAIKYSLGSSLPVGDFGDANSQNSASCYAQTGVSSTAGIKYQVTNGGFSLLLSSQTHSNTFDVAEYDRELTLLAPGTDWSVSSDAYSMSSFLVGLQQDFRVSEKTQLGVIAQLGLAFAEDPTMSVMEFNSGFWSVSSNNYSSAVAFKFGGQAKIELAKWLYFTVSADYLTASHDFTNTEIFLSDGDYQTASYSKDFNTINVQLGLSADLFRN